MSHKNPKYDPHKANLNNPTNDLYWQARGYEKRPDNWQDLLKADQSYSEFSTSSKSRIRKRVEDMCHIDSEMDMPIWKEDY